MFKRAFGFGIVFATALSGCTADVADYEDDSELAAVDEIEEIGEAEQALASCNAPMNAYADWIESTRTGQPWCYACTFVSIEIRRLADNSTVLNWWAGIDQVSYQYIPKFCFGGVCSGGFSTRTGIRGDWYGPVSVSLGGDVVFPGAGGATIQMNPQLCAAEANGVTTIIGLGSDNVYYSVRLSNTWFS